MKQRQWIAEYKCVKCGEVRTETCQAPDYHAALVRLPRYIWPNNHRMRRQGGVKADGCT